MSLLEHVKSIVRTRTGIAASTLGDGVFDAAISARCSATGLGRDAWFERLEASEAERVALVDAVVIPETWFFRDEVPFEVLGRFAAKRSLEARGLFRVLSLPCSTGEEPYSIAIALREAGLSPSSFRVDAIDVSSESIEKAKRAVYRDASFRGARSERVREHWCRATHGGHALDQEAQTGVHFRIGSVLDPECLASESPYDAIFCRNLLIYFDRATRDEAVRALTAKLSVGGLLFVGHAESLSGIDAGLVRLDDVRAFGYARVDEREASPRPALEPSQTRKTRTPTRSDERDRRRPKTLPPSLTPIATLARATPTEERPRAVEEPPRPGDATATDPFAAARKLADAGANDQARDATLAVIAREGPTAEGYHLLGVIAESEGRFGEAEKSFSRALYLDADHYSSLVHTALLRERRGDKSAERFRSRAERVARGGGR